MGRKAYRGLVELKVLITDRQRRLLDAIHVTRRTPENRLSRAAVIREALSDGLERQAAALGIELEEGENGDAREPDR